jgi:hypothetical protein
VRGGKTPQKKKSKTGVALPIRLRVLSHMTFLRCLLLLPVRVLQKIGALKQIITITASVLAGIAVKTVYDKLTSRLRLPSPSPRSPRASTTDSWSPCSTPPPSPVRQSSWAVGAEFTEGAQQRADDIKKGRAPSSPERREFDQEWAAARMRFSL